MICLGCSRLEHRLLCGGCEARLRPAPDRLVGEGVLAAAAFSHEGVARPLIHALKYRGVVGVAAVVAAMLAPRLPLGVPLVPLPRAVSRKIRYGIDPATEMASSLGAITGSHVANLLVPPLHSGRRAGRGEAAPPRFRLRSTPTHPVVLVDDVVTTGSTIAAAASVIGNANVVMAMTATSSPHAVTSLWARTNSMAEGSEHSIDS